MLNFHVRAYVAFSQGDFASLHERPRASCDSRCNAEAEWVRGARVCCLMTLLQFARDDCVVVRATIDDIGEKLYESLAACGSKRNFWLPRRQLTHSAKLNHGKKKRLTI
jgi:hypothetical protein